MVIIRLWHYKLISYLPNKMLVSQWRECIAIKRQWEKGTLKHSLVSYVMNYDKGYFRSYVHKIANEMNKRSIKFNYDLHCEVMRFTNKDKNRDRSLYSLNDILHYPEHNNRYLKQCYYNLQEKYDRGIINQEEWNLINKNIGGEIDEK